MHEPWHRAMDTKLETLKWHNADFGKKWTMYFFSSVFASIREEDVEGALAGVDVVGTVESLERLARESLHRSDVIFVTEDMQHILLQAADDLPDDIMLYEHDLLTPIGYCQFAEPMFGEDVNGRMLSISAISWIKYPSVDGLVLHLFYWSDHNVNDDMNPIFREQCRKMNIPAPPMGLSHWYPLIFEQELPDGKQKGSEVVVGMLKLFIAMQLIAQQRVGETIISQPSRAVRRRWHLEENSYISVITLRRRKAVPLPDHEPQKMEYSHRFLVSSHWRRQWYPSTKTHGWKYIHEFIKGPEDKPLVIRKGRVFNFRR